MQSLIQSDLHITEINGDHSSEHTVHSSHPTDILVKIGHCLLMWFMWTL
jgi:hypothetical protein